MPPTTPPTGTPAEATEVFAGVTSQPEPPPPPPGAPSRAAGLGDYIGPATTVANYYKEALDAAFEGSAMSFTESALKSLGVKLSVAAAETIFQPLETLLTKTEELGEQTLEVSSVIEGITGQTSLSIQAAGYSADSTVAKMSKASYEAVAGLADAHVMLANGVKAETAQFGDASDFLQSYSEAALRDSRLFRSATESTTTEMLTLTRLAQRNLGLTAAETNTILQRELSETGKISGEFLRNYEKTIVAAAQAAGQPIELLTADLNTMMADFTRFGNMTETQMAALSVTVSRLGMNISDVTKLADNFQSFDKASAAMSSLAASTGVTLDTLELFELANTDQEAFILSLRDQLESQGLEFDQLNFIQQKNIAAAFGIDPIIMKRMLNDNFDMVTSAQGEIADRTAKLSDEDTQRFVASMKRLDKLSGEDFIKRVAGMKAASEEYAVSIEKTYLASAKITENYVRAAGSALDDYGKQIQDYRRIMDRMSEKVFGPAPATPQSPGSPVTGQPPLAEVPTPATQVPEAPAAPGTASPAPAAPTSPSTASPGTPAGVPPTSAPTATAQQPAGPPQAVAPVATASGGFVSTEAGMLPAAAEATQKFDISLNLNVNVTGGDELVRTTAEAAGVTIVRDGVPVEGTLVNVSSDKK